MAFCTNCGSEVAEGVKFCANCGTPIGVEMGKVEVESNNPIPAVKEKIIDENKKRLSPIFGIIALILAIIAYLFHPSPLTIVFSIVAIGLSVFSFVKKGRLKGFAIAAVVIAAVNLLLSAGFGDTSAQNITYSDVTTGGITFQMPSNYSYVEEQSSDGCDIYATSKEDSLIVLITQEANLSDSLFESKANEISSLIDEIIAEMMTDYSLEGNKTLTVDGLKAVEQTYNGKIDGQDGYATVTVINNPGSKSIAMVVLVCTNKVKDKSVSAYTTFINTAKCSGSRATQSTASSVGYSDTADGVDPDLKAFLDSYEAFVDEYVDFMKSYLNDPGNVVTMLTQYTEIMTKYEDFAEKVDNYNTEEMSTEDAKYYLEVTTRCTEKMLDLY